MKRAVAALLLAALMISVAFVTGFVAFLPGPPVLQCGGIEDEVCEHVMEQAAQDPYDQSGGDVVGYEGSGPGHAFGPVAYFKFEPMPGFADCGDWTIEKYRWAIGPFAGMRQTWRSNPMQLCGT